ncbi:MAG: radical SAM family heme chaperone HemW [Crocinitomicaceae bacterium]|nr:radical SAM family heme chaperone HemW [Crocinitomicaceae bacterium]
MAGLYIHVPYCKVKCNYCDFHFSTSSKNQHDMLEAMLLELEMRKNYLADTPVETIYFGGGTPSVAGGLFISKILSAIQDNFNVSPQPEITVECNPDDITDQLLNELVAVGVNRLSLGVQSFDNEVLKMMNRAHDSSQIFNAINLIQTGGITNSTLDLIYGIPGKNMDYWKEQIDVFLSLNIPHLSAYCLTIEKKTVFGAMHRKGLLAPVTDELALEQFEFLVSRLHDRGYEQYEISNFAKDGYISKHNSAYWLDEKYLGIGPSAHSYNLEKRDWNISNNARYIRALKFGEKFSESEMITTTIRCNDYLLTRLRTKWGINLDDLHYIGEGRLNTLRKKTNQFLKDNLLEINADGNLILTKEGKFRADGITASLFTDDEG